MGFFIGDIVTTTHFFPNGVAAWVIIGKRINTCSVQYRMASLSAGAALCPSEAGSLQDCFTHQITRRIRTMSREEMLTSANPLIRRAGEGENVNGITDGTMISEAKRREIAKMSLYRKGWK